MGIKYVNKFTGYQNYMDITNMPVTSLAPGSQNIFIEDGSKLEPRAGMDYFGVPGQQGQQIDPYWTLANRIHSKYDDFVNKQGVKIPVRVYYSGGTSVGDIIEVWLPNYINGVAQNTNQWYRINAITPSNPIVSKHRYYWAEWFDPALTIVQPELIFTYGGLQIANWSGGFAPITSLTATTITTNGIWSAKGFIGAPEGTDVVVINGFEYTVTGGFGTNTITVTSTAGMAINDIVFQNIYFQIPTGTTGITFDVCSSINNQVYYIDWNQRNVYISWDRNQVATVGFTIFNGVGLDDGLYGGTYSGTTDLTYQAVISSTNRIVFTPGGLGSSNNITFDTTGYTGTVGTLNKYDLTIIADATIFVASTSGVNLGDSLTGSATMATGVVTGFYSFGSVDFIGVRMTSNASFSDTDTITTGSGVTVTGQNVDARSWFQFSKNGTVQNIDAGAGALPFNILLASITMLTDGLVANVGNIYGHAVGDTFTLYVSGPYDTFQWRAGTSVLSAPTTITGSAQALSNGVTIIFTSRINHTVGDSWTMTALPTVIRGWSNFSYTNPSRRAGQGFTLLLDSNGWTMKPQETRMLINSSSGHFYDVELRLSSDLLSETIKITRLKSEPQNKVLFPYLINYIKNQLVTISSDKTFDLLGRQKFLELQQSKTLSDAVRIDFETVDWQDADIIYYKRKIFFNVPRTTDAGTGSCVFVYDDYRKYWHPPQRFGRRISLLSIIDNKLIGHSYERNESYELFTGLNDLDLFPIETKIVMPYDSSGNRYVEKSMDAIGFEGYILGNPEIKYTINAGVGGCEGQEKGTIAPQNTPHGLCLPNDKSSLGKSNLGFHGLGNDPVDVIPHFFYIKQFDNMTYYQRNIEISCTSLEQRWSIISLGTSQANSFINSESITDKG